MNLEAKTVKLAVGDAVAFRTRYAGSGIAAPKKSSEVAMAGLAFMSVADWNALKLEFHHKLRELEMAGNGHLHRVKSDLETRVDALQEKLSLLNPASVNTMANLSHSAEEKRHPINALEVSSREGSSKAESVRGSSATSTRLGKSTALMHSSLLAMERRERETNEGECKNSL